MKTYTQLIEELIEAHPLSTTAGARTRLARAKTAHTLSTIYRMKSPNKNVTGHNRPYYPKKARANQERNVQRAKDAEQALKGHGESQANIDAIADAGANLASTKVNGTVVQGMIPSKTRVAKIKSGYEYDNRKKVDDRKQKEVKPNYALY